MTERIFETISDFAEKNDVEIEIKFDCVGELIIKMTRKKYVIRKRTSRGELHWLEDCDGAVLIQLHTMLQLMNKNFGKPVLTPKKESEEWHD